MEQAESWHKIGPLPFVIRETEAFILLSLFALAFAILNVINPKGGCCRNGNPNPRR